MTSHEVLKKYWGYSVFRPLQEEIIQSIIEGKDTLALLPTGGGKSICYQVPAIMQKGVCIVVSPLIALMQDQISQLHKRGIPAIALHSGISKREITIELESMANGRYKMVYMSPERLQNPDVVVWLKNTNVSFIAVDEAHCISQWGHDFRPAYRRIALVLAELNVPCIALTATATEDVQKDIVSLLELKRSNVFKKSFKRDNLSLSLFNKEDKEGKIISILQKTEGCAIVYARNRQKCKEINHLLNKMGISSTFYHGGLEPQERENRQKLWINDKVRCMVCTNAFGMGIDKPNVRFVIHESPPDNLEAYYQEAGRAGRDGIKSFATMLFNKNDVQLMKKFHILKFPENKVLQNLLNAIYNYHQIAIDSGLGITKPFKLHHFCEAYKLDLITAYNGLKLLVSQEVIALTEAVFRPATVFILVKFNALYEYRMKHTSANALFEVLLRQSQSFFEQSTRVDIDSLAKATDLGIDKTKKMLMQLHSLKIIEYKPSSTEPLLTFLINRPPNLEFKWEGINKLKKAYSDKIKATDVYLRNTETCRMKALVAYFNEELKEDCTICDVCIVKRKNNNKEEKIAALKKKLVQKLEGDKINYNLLVDNYSSTEIIFVKEALQILLDEGIIAKDNHNSFWVTKKE